MANGRTISNADRRLIAQRLANEGGRTISDADRRLIARMLANEGGRTISDADRRLAQEGYLRRNDGGIARKTRTF
jgi:hypothetical protein